MRIKVRHETRYSYATPAISALQLLRMTPRPHDGQFVRRWRVEIGADARLTRSEDAYGNITHMVFVAGPVDGVSIQVVGEVDVANTAGIVHGSVERQPERFFLRRTALTEPTPQVSAFVDDLKPQQSGDILSSLHRLNSAIHAAMTFKPGATGPATTAGDAFAAGVGVCQDFAHIFITCARSIGVPARYVSGYYLRDDTVDQDAGHAWAEAYVEGIGWIGFDPAHGLCVTDSYVRVAIGCDYLEASPVRGAQIGGSNETLEVAVQIQSGRSPSDMSSQFQFQSQG